MRAFLSFLAVLALLTGLTAAPAEAGDRVALVIGNSGYAAVGRLENPANDAAAIGRALQEVGFEVQVHYDLDRSRTVDVLGEFRARAQAAEAAIIYYAGHGIEVDRRNYMIPVDARLAAADDVDYQAVPLDLAMGAVAGAGQLSLVIVDACRNNPFLAQMRTAGSKRAIGRGLGAVEPIGNTLVAYAAREGTVAADGTGRNSPYAAALIKALGTEGLEIGKLFRQVRDDVLAATRNEQEPFLYGSLSAQDFYFRPPSAVGATPPPLPGGGPSAADFELTFWKTVLQMDRPEGYREYLERYPDGVFAPMARLKLDDEERRREPPADPAKEPPAGKGGVEPAPSRPREERPGPGVAEFTARNGIDIPGNDIPGADRRGVTLQDCVDLCARLDGCRAFAYVEAKGWCWPKSAIGSVVRRAGIKSAAIKSLEDRLYARDSGDGVEYGVDFPGEDLTIYGMRDMSLGACRAWCERDARCVGYSYVEAQAWCWPKRAVSDRVRRAGVVSERLR